jgi:hypothetical protein
MSRCVPSLLAVVLLATPLPVKAAVTLSLAPVAQNSARGREVVFSGTLTNTSPTEKVFLNDLQATIPSGASGVLALEPNTFFASVPGILLPGEAYSGVLFRLSLAAAAPADDYAGTIAVKGGSDIFAASDLVSAPFTIFSPDVTIVATDASASEFGTDSGAITITRTGGTDLALAVAYNISGSAVNGVSYAAVSGVATIPEGASSVAISIVPLPDDAPQGDRVATFSLAPSSAFNPGAAVTASVTIHDKPVDQWRLEQFAGAAGDAAAQDLADWDGDGVVNLLEYALGLDPKAAVPDALPQADALNGYATFSFVPNPAATDVTFTVEACTDLVNWSTEHIEAVTIENPVPSGRVTVRYDIPRSSAGRVFFHLKVTRLD